jgi:hypothetical protein
MPYGERRALGARDVRGNTWHIATVTDRRVTNVCPGSHGPRSTCDTKGSFPEN